jgi:hypothetical protein
MPGREEAVFLHGTENVVVCPAVGEPAADKAEAEDDLDQVFFCSGQIRA